MQMKKYLLVIFFLALFSDEPSAQTLRKCGCQTWNDWRNTAKNKEGTRKEKRLKYANYREECIAACKSNRANQKDTSTKKGRKL